MEDLLDFEGNRFRYLLNLWFSPSWFWSEIANGLIVQAPYAANVCNF